MAFSRRYPWIALAMMAVLFSLTQRARSAEYDVILRGGRIYDGSGDAAFVDNRIAQFCQLPKVISIVMNYFIRLTRYSD